VQEQEQPAEAFGTQGTEQDELRRVEVVHSSLVVGIELLVVEWEAALV